MQTLLPLVREYGSLKARKWLEGEEELAIADDDLTSFLARQDVGWDHLLTVDQDCLRDAYIEAGKTEMARRLTGSDPVASSLPVSVAPAASCASTAPLVPEVVKVAVEALGEIQELQCDCTNPEQYRDDVRILASSALTALRSYSPVPSPSVELLKEATGALDSCDKSFACWQVGQIPGRPEDILSLIVQVRNTLAKLNAELA